jgi:hypothetical protein
MESIALIALLFPGLAFLFVIVGSLLLHTPELSKIHRNGFCDRCNYDLTGNTSGKCPECGLRIAPPG